MHDKSLFIQQQHCHCCFMAIMIMGMFVYSTSADVRTVFVPENTKSGTIVADLSDYQNEEAVTRINKNFKMLNQNLISQRNKYSHKRMHRLFQLNEAEGVIVTRGKLDREELCPKAKHCIVRLQIYEKSSTQMIELNIEIIDENEYPPTFPVSSAMVNISEGANVGDVFSVDHCRATDRDSSFNSSIVYSLDPNQYFSLKQFKDETGTTRLQINLLQTLDYEVESFHRLTLRASDSGSPALSSKISLQVGVTDENDNPPKFAKQEYSVAFQENLGSGQIISQLQAEDADSGLAGTVNYFISGPNHDETSALFNINQNTGEITLKQDLDRETMDEIVVFIEAKDFGIPQLVGRTRLVVYVSDINDNSPIITVSFIYTSKDNTVYLSESMKKHSYFAHVIVKDYDLDANGQVQISVKATAVNQLDSREVNEDVSGMFRLAEDGFLVLNKELDREKQNRYYILLNATDRGTRQRWSMKELHVVVLDENDHSPVFPQEILNVSISESADVGTQLIQMQASDLDSSNPSALAQKGNELVVASTNGDITYSLDAGATGTFSIEPRTGVITLVSPLDREQISIWVLSVTAIDNGYPSNLRSSCRLLVTVNDTNDNPPVFTNPLQNDATVYATILRDDVITRIQAFDYDEGDNGLVRYILRSVDHITQTSRVNSSLLLLDATTGDLRLNMSHLNLTKALGRHTAVIQARDLGFPPMRTARTINVIVTDDLVLPSIMNDLHTTNVAVPSKMIAIIAASSAALILILIVVCIVVIRCNKKRQKSNKKKQMPIDANEILSSTNKQLRYSANLSKCGSMDNTSQQKCLKRHVELMTYDTSSTDVTLLSRTDHLVQRHFQDQSDLNKTLSSREGTLKKPQMRESSNPPPPRDGASRDVDSGRGDSDPGLSSPYEQGCSHRNSFGPNCNEQCIEYGHSDHCWMPRNTSLLSPSRNGFDYKHQRPISKPVFPYQRHSGCSEHGLDFEVIAEQQTLPIFYHAAASENMDLTSIYSKTLPHVLVTPATWTENLNLEVADDSVSSLDFKRTDSSLANTAITYVTESEVI